MLTTNEGIDQQLHQVNVDEWSDSEFGRIRYCSNHVKALWSTLRQLRKDDVLHLSSLFYYPAFMAALYCYIRGQRWIWSPRGECSPQALRYSTWKKKPVLFLLKKISHKAIFHATAPKESAEIRALFGPDVQIVECGNFCFLDEPLNLPVKKQLLFVGRIHPIKAIENLIEAVSISARFRQQDFTLKIVGKADKGQELYLEQLKQQVSRLGLKDRVIFAGHLAGMDKQTAYATSYGLVLPSHTENFGNVVLEALNQGTPAIASLNTPWELLPQHNAGFHVSNEPAALAGAIDALLLQDPESYQRMRKNAYQLCENNFSIEKNIDRWIQIYRDILQ